MNKVSIIETLKKNGMSNIEELKSKDEVFVLRFTYDFDDAEIEAAKAYANDESEDEEEGEEWFDEFFLPYLNDLAVDNVGEIIEEIMENLEIGAQYVSYDMDEEEYEYNEFVAVFFKEGSNIEIESILEELEL